MPNLYHQLTHLVYEQAFVRRVVLPGWRDDSMADDPTSRVQAELRVAQRLSLPLADVTDGKTNHLNSFASQDWPATRLSGRG
jgi:hypothetical protein